MTQKTLGRICIIFLLGGNKEKNWGSNTFWTKFSVGCLSSDLIAGHTTVVLMFQLKVQWKILDLKFHYTLEYFVKCAKEAWMGFFFILEFLIFFSSILNSCTGKAYYGSADRTWFILFYLSAQSYLVSQFCFRKLFWKLFWKCRFIQLPALDIRIHSFTQPGLALGFFL